MRADIPGLFKRLVNALIPEQYRDYGREAMRCRVLVTVLVGLVIAESMLYLFLDKVMPFSADGKYLAYSMISFILTASIASLALFWLTEHRELCSNLFGLSLWGTLCFVTWHTGGTESVALPLFLLLPVFMTITGGSRWGFAWTVFVMATWVAALVASNLGFEFPLITQPENHVLGQIICLAVTCFLVSIAILQYETTTNRLWEDLHQDTRVFEHLARHDQLTGLPNRRYFADELEQAIARANRHDFDFALFFFDLNDFKIVNDNYGHDVGDVLLIELGLRLDGRFRSTDFVARWGGDEFAIIVENIASSSDIQKVRRDLDELTREPIETLGKSFAVETSVGVAIYPRDGRDGKQLVQTADQAMYRAKKERKASNYLDRGLANPLTE
jgi:diguanylate cyclase (GGDEF)-like protein